MMKNDLRTHIFFAVLKGIKIRKSGQTSSFDQHTRNVMRQVESKWLSTHWLLSNRILNTTEIHLHSIQNRIFVWSSLILRLFYFCFSHCYDLPCEDTALDRAKSILLATMITGRVRIKSISCSDCSNCSTRVNDALSTTENTRTNASHFSSSSWKYKWELMYVNKVSKLNSD